MGRTFDPGKGKCWKTTVQTNDDSTPGMERLAMADRLLPTSKRWRFKRYLDDFGYQALGNWWDNLGGTADLYVVQTNPEIVQRCMLMTTKPGDLVLDPTCGSGTTAYVAEKWGRRWITMDTSRVALAIARQRILSSTFPFYRLQENGDDRLRPGREFVYQTAPHVTLGDIANNAALDAIEEKHRPVLDERLKVLNVALCEHVTDDLRRRLTEKLARKQKEKGKRAVTEADERRWRPPEDRFEHWTVPFDADEDWPEALKTALDAYRAAWRKKRDEVEKAVAAGSEHEVLYDRPEIEKSVVRVSGPFTVEAVMPAELSLDEAMEETPIGGAPDELDAFGGDAVAEAANAEAYLDKLTRLLREDGARFLGNQTQGFTRLDRISDPVLHAEGEWTTGDGEGQRVAISFGPEHGAVTAPQVEEALHYASKRGYDHLIVAGFNFDGAAQAAIQDDPNPRVRVHMASVAPDVIMDDLLKKPADAQLFTVFGQPRTALVRHDNGTCTVRMEGMDVYDPVTNTLKPTKAQKVAAWFVDADYDGRTFCISQAFFPDKSAWEKIARALKGQVEPDVFERLSGTESLPFRPGEHRRVAVKVIDPRGNEALRIHRLDGATY